MNLVDNLDGVRRRALLRAHLHKLSILALCLHQQRALGRIVAAWLFNIHMLPRLQSRDRHGRVPVVGSGDGDGVHFLQLKDVPEVLVGRRSVSQFALGIVGEFLQSLAVDIADVGDARGAFVGFQRGEVRIGTAVKANDSKVETIVGPHNLSIALGG